LIVTQQRGAHMIERQAFGKTGHESSRVLFGAAALAAMRQDRADRVLETLLEFGINHIDTAASYGDAELRLAPWLREHRDRFFLATKTRERTGDGARRGLEASLERMQVSSVDMIQLHNLVDPDEWALAHGPGGAVEALAQARDEGLVRFIGVTGHGTRVADMHARSLARFDFDSVLLPCNFTMMSQPEYRADFETLAEICRERGVAIQTIKSLARRRWADDATGPRFSWYEPLRDPDAIARAVRYVLSGTDYFLNSSSDATLLRPTLEAADDSSRPAPDAQALAADVTQQQIEPLFIRDVAEGL
jgi:aryl-alcohol dehydrogenase-like predicted oxidoreductase